MREIKFRAWWKDTMKPIPSFTDDYVIDACNEDIFIVSQFTGLKDKNGNDIYESDIVYIAGLGNCLVKWDCCGYWAFGRERNDYQDVMEGLESVVGNLYETPELLEGEE